MQSQWNIALGFFQNLKTADAVFNKLKKAGLKHSTLIHRDHYGKISVAKNFIHPINAHILTKLQRIVISDESLVLIQVKSQDVQKALSILRHVESGHPTSFLLRANEYAAESKNVAELVKEPLTLEQMQESAHELALQLKDVGYNRQDGIHLLTNLKDCEQTINHIRHIVSEAEFVEQTITPSAEWLLDNAYVIQGNIEEVQRNLPKKFYHELPKVLSGPMKGLPRVYVVAKDMVRCTANRLNRDNIIAYIDSYQSVDSLTIAELWVLPLMLRVRLIECLKYLSIDIDRRLREGEYASFWGNRLLNVARREPERLEEFLDDMKNQLGKPSLHFAEELIDHLYDEEKIVPQVKSWIEEQLKNNIQDIIKEEHIQKSSEQIALSNAIVSLISLSQLSWREIFEQISPIDKILSKDPCGVYLKMNFTSRDAYRHAVEVLARGSKQKEGAIAAKVLHMAQNGKDEVSSHVGYYLVDKGRVELEHEIKYKPTIPNFLRRQLIRHPAASYLGSIFILTLLLFALLAFAVIHWTTIGAYGYLLLGLALIPVSEISVQIISLLVTKILNPYVLPKLLFKDGIPEDLKTFVVIPTLLSSSEDIEEAIHKLEIRYLANSNDGLMYGIYFDYIDASQKEMPSDSQFLSIAEKGIEALNEKYGPDKFFLLYRDRVWSESEKAWIGLERKRGKLEALNRFLVEEDCPETKLKVGNRDHLRGVRYVITLDADTELPKDTAKQLIETIAHPLNVSRISEDGRVQRGYTIIQPRVATDLTRCRTTWFAEIFSDPQSLNPYTQAISDVYQDLTSEGNYHGKGIYDVQSFHRLVGRLFPRNHLLSHDLLEGEHVRVGYASDIILSDDFPQDYFAWTKRQHRWMRGDWQIIDWIFRKVPILTGKKVLNPLSVMSRWKIIDNIRRSLIPLTVLGLLIAAFFVSAIPVFWAAFVAFVYFIPPIFLFLFNSITSARSFLMSWKDLYHSILRSVINIALIPQQAYLSLDVMARVFYRRGISSQNLLEWESFKAKSSNAGRKKFVLGLSFFSLFSIILFGLIAYYHPLALRAAAPYCLLWLCAPAIVSFLERNTTSPSRESLTKEDQLFLHNVARRTWRYFDDFVGPQTNWLPPDNYQAALTVEVAQRTSPTNIGLWMLAILSAHDFKYIDSDDVLDRLYNTFQSFKKLEMYEGHFLNWYDIQTLKPLNPRYVSTVDSGNLLASFWTLEQGIIQLSTEPMLTQSVVDGLKDTVNVALEYNADLKEVKQHLDQFNKTDKSSLIDLIERLSKEIQQGVPHKEPSDYWMNQFLEQLNGWENIVNRYFKWLKILKEITIEDLKLLDPNAEKWLQACYLEPISMLSLAAGERSEALNLLLENLKSVASTSTKIKSIHERCSEALKTTQWLAGEKLGVADEIIADINQLCDGLNMRFLYNTERKLFSIGYHVDDRRLDNSYYDLLASEARIASFVSIAKDDVPLEHWWALGRPYGYLYGRYVLMSWGGTMFEYLMPMLFKNYYPDSLVGEGCEDAVACQMAYAEHRGIPWGISEAAYSAIDAHRIYQYRSFGVPGLGFKRGLEEDLVVSPYSTALALAIDPRKAIDNLKKLKTNMLNDYGFYESIDFTRQRAPQGERGVIVYAFMAHHQGMSLLAFNNVLNNNPIRQRFHSNPRVIGMESLLNERTPVFPNIAKGSRKEIPLSRLAPFSTTPIMGIVDTPHSTTPKINLLSNSAYAVMVTNSGGGYSQWKDIDVTRWRADTTKDNFGSFFYIKDVPSGSYWSVAFHPVCSRTKKYSVSFKADRTEIRRTDHQIETHTEIVVSPEDDAEIRLITIGNLSPQQRVIELTSYVELALAPHAADAAHPAFNKMFIETESVPDSNGLLAFRRLKDPDDKPIFAGHVVASSTACIGPIQFETDRLKFVGRGHTLHEPLAMENKLSNSEGYVLDPIFSLRYQIKLEPGQRIQVSFVTLISDNRDKTLALIKKYSDISSHHRAIDMAWAHAQLELRHLRVHQEEVQLFQKLASRILYPQGQLRPSTERLIRNRKGQSALWAYGISGDLPIVVVTVADLHDVDLIRQVLTAHIFLRMRNLKSDLVILNEEGAGYEHPLFDQLQRLIMSFSSQIEFNKAGGVYLLNSDQIPEEDLLLIHTVARANLIAARGSLRQQLVAPMEAATYPRRLIPDMKAKDFPSPPLPFVELKYFNEFGGFSPDGREYMIFLGQNVQTPLPWINVIANAKFGTLVSETGLGTTWFGNSQTNRLTPWSNDPVLNTISDTIYIRDDDLGTYWTVTPGPIRELDAYRVRHGQGYSRFEHNSHGIEQDLTILVPVDEKGGLPLRMQKLKLKNVSGVKRKLSFYSYTELVLGFDREQTQMHVITTWDAESQALFAFNRYNADYGNNVAFACTYPLAHSYSGNRTEFVGRNGHLSNPAAMRRRKLSGLTGAAGDPAAILQVKIELDVNEEKEVIFILGYAEDEQIARQLINQCREPTWAKNTYTSTLAWWDILLKKVQVNTPADDVNISFNRWLLYQDLSCRFWGRTAFYQSSGAFGFRDQLQDAMALLYAAPELAREQILLAASRQFEEGDVQHWWHPPHNGGVRTRISDDLLWLPYVTAQYIRVTNDVAILNEEVSFIKGELLKEDQHEAYFVPEVSTEKASLLEHCRRALKKGSTAGSHGLPLIGGGDWNDGMNRVGVEGKGESVWLAWFLIHVMNDFADLLAWTKDHGYDEGFRAQSQRLAETIEESSWDGQWYRRAYYDDGQPLGSNESVDAKIDCLAQSWAVISKAGNPERIEMAFKALEEHVIKVKEKMVLLLTPSFDKGPLNPGYIKGYPPGVRENGGQYTHGSLWVPLAYAMRGDGDKAMEILRMMNPIAHTSTKESAEHFKVEPYVLAADVYNLPGQVGRGGWTWYTGSAAWMYRIFLENVFGFKLRGEILTLEPVLPKAWNQMSLHYQHHKTTYDIFVERADIVSVELDNKILDAKEIQLCHDELVHTIRIKINK